MDEKIYVRHQKETRPDVARVTVVAVVKNESLHFAAARCSEGDQFCRATGRKLATSRLNKPILSIGLIPGKSVVDQFVRHGDAIVKNLSLCLMNKFKNERKKEKKNEEEVALNA